MELYTNSNTKSDFIRNALNNSIAEEQDIYIATAFYTEYEIIEQMTKQNCHVKLIVRLGFPTNPDALRKALNNNNVDVRFFTSNSFHPKLYIFGSTNALVGSANLTQAAIQTNQEIIINLQSDDPRFHDLQNLFEEYWEQASVLNMEVIKQYESIYTKARQAAKLVREFDDSVVDLLGNKTFKNIDWGKTKHSKESLFYESYSKSYQVTTTAFNHIIDEYKKKNRKVDDNAIPLRLEVDSFFSFVRDNFADKDKWKDVPIGWNSERKKHLLSLVDEWLITDWPHFEKTIVNKNYPLIKKTFISPDSINAASYDQIVESLCVLHAFYEQLRFHKGGLETLKSDFKSSNDITKVKATLNHLLFGKGNIIKRMSDCLHNPKYQLKIFGESTVQELVGWMNNEELPVINGRTTKVLRYFGFKVKQL